MILQFAANDIAATVPLPTLKAKIIIMNENRQNIIFATERLLQTHGLARLTMREIAREAKVAEGLIYHHFKDKAELIFEVVETRFAKPKTLCRTCRLSWVNAHSQKIWKMFYFRVYHAHYEITPIICSIFADQQLHVRIKEIVKERECGSTIRHRRIGRVFGGGTTVGTDLGYH